MFKQRLQSLVILLIASLTTTSSLLGAEGGALDVVMLIDISDSMRDQTKKGDLLGNDPEQLRWDAAKLVLDLLGKEDRLLILPFNQECPAETMKNKFEPELSYATDALREKLGPQIESLIPDGVPSKSDNGQTGLMRALEVAGQKIASGQRLVRDPIRRNVVVFLLTDGKQDLGVTGIPRPDDKSRIGEGAKLGDESDDLVVDSGAWKSDKRVTFFAENKIPIHCIGLGEKVDKEFLGTLSERMTNGKLIEVKQNTDLVDKFRELIWFEGRCWIESIQFDAEKKRAYSRSLDNVLDLGVLLYQDLNVNAAPSIKRQRWAPNPIPAHRTIPITLPLDRKLPGDKKLQHSERYGKNFPSVGRHAGYAYLYFDGRGKGLDLLLGPDMQLVFQTTDKEPVRGYFIKRVTFSMVPRFSDRTFYRNEPIDLEVFMEGVDTSKYEMEVQMTSTRDRTRSRRFPMLPEKGKFRAAADFTAELLLPATETELSRTETYKLEIHVKEKINESEGQQRDGYKNSFRVEENVVVRNLILLDAPKGDLVIDRTHRILTIPVMPHWPLKTSLPVKLKTHFPRHEDASEPLAASHFKLASNPPAARSDETQIKDGKLEITIELPKGSDPAAGNYEAASVTIASLRPGLPVATWHSGAPDDDLNQHEIPWNLHYNSIALKTQLSAGGELSVGPKADSDKCEILVRFADEAEAGSEPRGLNMKLKPFRDAERFSAEELWIQEASDDGGVVGKAERFQEKAISPGKNYELHFHPDPKKHLNPASFISAHSYLLVAEGARESGVERNECPLRLVVQRPEVEWQQVGRLLQLGWGVTANVHFKGRLRWLSGGKLPLMAKSREKLQIVEVSSEKSRLRAIYDLAMLGLTEQIVLRSPEGRDDADTGWTDLNFTINIPENVNFGPYEGQIQFRLNDSPVAAPLILKLQTNRLASFGDIISQEHAKLPEIGPLIAPLEKQRVRVTQFFDRAMTVTLEVRTKLPGTQLDPAVAKIHLADGHKYLWPIRDDGKQDVDFLPPPLVAEAKFRRNNQSDSNSLFVDIPLRVVRNATPNVPYKIDLSCNYCNEMQGVDLGELPIELEITFVDPSKVLNSE